MRPSPIWRPDAVPVPTIAGTLKVLAPTFIRKLGRASHWGQPGDPVAQRIQGAVDQVFRNQVEPEMSVYLLNTDEDFRRVAIAMNANRDSLHETIAFITFQPSDLEAVGIPAPLQSIGDLKCDHANALHRDMMATDFQLGQLCTRLMNAGREAARCSGGMMKEAEKLALGENCKSVPNVLQCGVNNCKPPDGGTSPRS